MSKTFLIHYQNLGDPKIRPGSGPGATEDVCGRAERRGA